MSETTKGAPNSPKKMESPFSLSEAEEEDTNTAEANSKEDVDPFEDIREHFKSLYESNDFLGYALCDSQGEILINESFLSREGVTKAVETYLASYQQMVDSGRAINRVTLEMDDIVVIFQSTEPDGIGLFILPSDSNIDKAAKLIDDLPSVAD